MPDWNAIVRARLRELGEEPPDHDIVEELATHLAQAYDT